MVHQVQVVQTELQELVVQTELQVLAVLMGLQVQVVHQVSMEHQGLVEQMVLQVQVE